MSKLRFPTQGWRSLRSLCTVILILAAGTGCASAAGSAGAPGNSRYPGSSVPGSRPIPAEASFYKRIPQACSTLDMATLLAIAPGSAAGSETDTTRNGVIGDGVIEHICTWDASAPHWTRSVLVLIDVETGPDARIDADGAYQDEVSYTLGPAQPIRGLGEKSQLNERQMKTSSSDQLHVLRRNVVITVEYQGNDHSGPMTSGELRNGTMAAARSVLAAVR